MGLIDEAAELSGKSGPQTSRILRLVEQLTGKERAEVVELIWDHPELTARSIATVLTDHYGDLVGDISQQQVQDHRKKPRP